MISTDTQEIVAHFRLSGWSEAVSQRIASRQTVDAFCAEKGISKNTYYYRQKRVKETACAELAKAKNGENRSVPTRWVKLNEPEQAAGNTLTIEIGGCHITADSNTDPELLAKVCRVLRSL